MKGKLHCTLCGGTGDREMPGDAHRSAGIIPCFHDPDGTDPRRGPSGPPRPAPARPPGEPWGGAARARAAGAATPTPAPGAAPPAGSPARRWEYLVQQLPGNILVQRELLGEYGQEGWELVSVIAAVAYMKRPCP